MMCLIEKENHAPSKSQTVCEKFPFIGTCLSETVNNVPTLEEEGRQVLRSSARIKVQLFPIDETTRQELEKGGYNPHLELTVSKRKKISSVLRHLKSKWSNVYSMGEFMLFPYNIQLENLIGERRWTSADTETSAAEVYEAIGSPAIFRLRYGWFPSSTSLCTPFTSSLFKDCLQNENIKQGESINVEDAEVGKQQYNTVTKECAPISFGNSPNVVQVECVRSDRATELLEKSRIGWGRAPSKIGWGRDPSSSISEF
ncbi:Tsl-kinase interacting protein 1-like [Thalictrum thalictroides]|uniref:Tsl-kinase interacting protein 1-like n=1 Tax=Thalictrum thalictroides TaxID=46969 RepID=A0A7J6URJ6_THATH|nr:Tsl-kinase interacting protein 1-like [Thalictrum thalictroides]